MILSLDGPVAAPAGVIAFGSGGPRAGTLITADRIVVAGWRAAVASAAALPIRWRLATAFRPGNPAAWTAPARPTVWSAEARPTGWRAGQG